MVVGWGVYGWMVVWVPIDRVEEYLVVPVS